MKSRLTRLLHGIIFAVLFVLAAGFAMASAQPPAPPINVGDCLDCHEVIQSVWEHSGHALAGENPNFILAWKDQGEPNDCMACHTTGYDAESGEWDSIGVSCSTCHFPIPGDHPDQVAPTNVSSRLCGNCHLDTFSELEQSIHGQEGLTCNRCHNAHTTDLKTESVQELCQACHQDQSHYFSYTSHFEYGLLCTDCHLKVEEGVLGEGHGSRQHTFAVELETCTDCHSEGLHYPIGMGVEEFEGPNLTSLGVSPSLMQEPSSVSPFGFSVLAALVGMAAGMLLSPWLENWYQRVNR